MISVIKKDISIEYEKGFLETQLSNGWTVKQQFGWEVDSDGLDVSYDTDIMDVIGAEETEEYSEDEAAALESCVWDSDVLKEAVECSDWYREAVEEFEAQRDLYGYYGG